MSNKQMAEKRAEALDLPMAIAQAWSPTEWGDISVLVAVSGGADSVALLRGMVAAHSGGAGRMIVGHFNHRLRGADSDADEAFVRELSTWLELTCEVGSAPDAPVPTSAPPEETTRAARYAFLLTAARRHGARHIVTAHTADDQAETVIHRILRGTGIAGLAGIPRIRALGPDVSLVRPLLTMRRAELRAWLARIGQGYREDTSNVDHRFTRNRIRQELLPHLAQRYNPDVNGALIRLAGLAGEAQQVIDTLSADLAARCLLSQTAIELRLDCAVLRGAHPYIMRETLIALWQQQRWPLEAMGHEQWRLLADMATTPIPPAKQTLPGGIAVERDKGDILLFRSPADSNKCESPE
jgi:tRNA(Ile)-lysidine synthase